MTRLLTKTSTRFLWYIIYTYYIMIYMYYSSLIYYIFNVLIDEEDVRVIVPTDNSFNPKPFHIINGPEGMHITITYIIF